jgi:hypothetical protein
MTSDPATPDRPEEVRMALAHCYPTMVNAVYHVVRVDGLVFVAACNRWTRLDADTERSLSSTSTGMRCRRPACLTRWEARHAG